MYSLNNWQGIFEDWQILHACSTLFPFSSFGETQDDGFEGIAKRILYLGTL